LFLFCPCSDYGGKEDNLLIHSEPAKNKQMQTGFRTILNVFVSSLIMLTIAACQQIIDAYQLPVSAIHCIEKNML